VRTHNPASGATIWESCFQEGPSLGAFVCQHRLLGIEVGDVVLLLHWGNGTTHYQAASPDGGQFWSTPTLSSSAV
jgi:hypothetical protein